MAGKFLSVLPSTSPAMPGSVVEEKPRARHPRRTSASYNKTTYLAMPVSSETKGIFGTFNGIGRRASRYMLLPSHSGEMKPRSRPNTLIVVVLVGVVLLLVEVVLRLT